MSTETMKAESNPHFTSIISYAKGVMSKNGQTELDLPHIAVGAYAALNSGGLQGSRVLQFHMQQYKPEIERYLELKQWRIDSAPDNNKYDITGALNTALNESERGDDPLLAFINASLNAINDEIKLFNTAIHEAGHAVVSLLLRPEVRLVKVTIEPDHDMGASGYAQFDSSNVTFKEAPSREFAREHICVALAGRIAQVAEFGLDAADVGAMSDMDAATEMACKAVMIYGMDNEIGPISLDVVAKTMNRLPGSGLPGELIKQLLQKLQGLVQAGKLEEQEFAVLLHQFQQSTNVSQPTGYLYDLAQRRVQILIKEAYAYTNTLVRKNHAAIRAVANLLIEKKTVTEEELLANLPPLNHIEFNTQGA